MSKIWGLIIGIILAIISIFSWSGIKDAASGIWNEITDQIGCFDESLEESEEFWNDYALPVDPENVPAIKEDTEEIPAPVIEDEIQKIDVTPENEEQDTDAQIDNYLDSFGPGVEENDIVIFFGNLYMHVPDGYEIDYEYENNDTFSIYGTNAETGSEFEIFATAPDHDWVMSYRLEDLAGAIGIDEVRTIGDVRCIIFYDAENDVDMCIAADDEEDRLILIAFNRPEQENIGGAYFETLGRFYLDE